MCVNNEVLQMKHFPCVENLNTMKLNLHAKIFHYFRRGPELSEIGLGEEFVETLDDFRRSTINISENKQNIL